VSMLEYPKLLLKPELRWSCQLVDEGEHAHHPPLDSFTWIYLSCTSAAVPAAAVAAAKAKKHIIMVFPRCEVKKCEPHVPARAPSSVIRKWSLELTKGSL